MGGGAAWACLDLLLGAGGDVGDGPAGLLLDTLLLAGLEQVQQAGQRAAVDDDLRLEVVSSDDVAHRTQRWHQHVAALVPASSRNPTFFTA